jgi:amidohydrolase
MKEKIQRQTQALKDELITLSEAIFEHPELGHEEYTASKLHCALLEEHGFDVTLGFQGLKTAFKAVYTADKPGPTIAYLAEYDALPGIGHGCGHNLLGTVSTGAGIVLKKVLDEIGGRVIVFGTPAEETSGAKVTFAENGVFDEVDVAMIAHPDAAYYKSGASLAMQAIQFDFHGRTAHAASAPEKGINALDAAIGTFVSINALRQHVKSDSRIHGIISDGGKAANIVPDFAQARFYVRAPEKAYLQELAAKVKNCARCAAEAVGASVDISHYELSYDNMLTNEALSSVFSDHLKTLGCSEIKEAREDFGSIDAGNVSHTCATIHPTFSIAEDQPIIAHTVAFAEATKTPYAYQEMERTVSALALTGVKVITDPHLFEQIQAEFEAATQVKS